MEFGEAGTGRETRVCNVSVKIDPQRAHTLREQRRNKDECTMPTDSKSRSRAVWEKKHVINKRSEAEQTRPDRISSRFFFLLRGAERGPKKGGLSCAKSIPTRQTIPFPILASSSSFCFDSNARQPHPRALGVFPPPVLSCAYSLVLRPHPLVLAPQSAHVYIITQRRRAQ